MKQNRSTGITLWLGTAAAGLLCAACASAPKPAPAADQPAGAFQMSPGKADVYVYREPGRDDASTRLEISLDNRGVGAVKPGHFVLWEVDPGFHSLSARGADGSVASSREKFESNRNYFFHAGQHETALSSNRVSLDPVGEDEGKRQVTRSVLHQSDLEKKP